MNRLPLGFLLLVWLSGGALAQSEAVPLETETAAGDYRVQHVVFNSTFLNPDIASRYQLKRSAYESLLNVSVYRQGQAGTHPATLAGTVKNLMQQQKTLEFITIEEQNAVYYLAPIRVGNEDTLHIELRVLPAGSDETLTIKFTQKVYADE